MYTLEILPTQKNASISIHITQQNLHFCPKGTQNINLHLSHILYTTTNAAWQHFYPTTNVNCRIYYLQSETGYTAHRTWNHPIHPRLFVRVLNYNEAFEFTRRQPLPHLTWPRNHNTKKLTRWYERLAEAPMPEGAFRQAACPNQSPGLSSTWQIAQHARMCAPFCQEATRAATRLYPLCPPASRQ